MADSHDSADITLDLCAYHIFSIIGPPLSSKFQLGPSVDRDLREALPHDGWSLHVSLYFWAPCALIL
jgi:hypothetical protein